MEQATRGTGVQVSRTADNRSKLDIPNDISFDTNPADIKPDSRRILDKFSEGLVDNTATQVSVIVHTDDTGSDAINDALSVERAAHTRDYLTTKMSRRIVSALVVAARTSQSQETTRKAVVPKTAVWKFSWPSRNADRPTKNSGGHPVS